MKSAVNANIPSEGKEDEFPLVAKIVLGCFLLLMFGVCLFAFSILCKSISASPTQILILIMIAGSLVVLMYFIGLADPLFLKKNKNGALEQRRLTVTEQIIAVTAIVSLCTGVVLWHFH